MRSRDELARMARLAARAFSTATSKAASKEASKSAAAADAAAAAAPVTKTAPPKERARPKLQPVSPTLKQFLGGVSETTRTDSLKMIWDYIRKHGLQDTENKSNIVCDDKLKAVLGKEHVSITEILGLLSPHFPKKEAKKS